LVNVNTRRFANDVVKPWDELNALLSERYAFQPDLSDVTRSAGALAVTIKHQADLAGCADRSVIDAASLDNKLMSDVGDFWKHGRLRDSGRHNSLFVCAMFEYDPGRGFRFLRNALFIQHATLAEHDFMHTSLAAIRYWLTTKRIGLRWSGVVAEGPAEFYPTAFLHYDPKYCISMSSTRLRFFARSRGGYLVPTDPPKVRVEIY
jgi:hypothetical protein